MTRLLGVLVTALLAWCGVMQPVQASAPTPATTVATYAYDNCHHAALPTCTTSERGPPAEPYRDIANPAAGHRPDGALARSARTATSIAYTYDALAPLAQAARDAGTTHKQVQDERAALSALGKSRVAANTAGRMLGVIRAGELKQLGVPKGAIGTPVRTGKSLEYPMPRGTPGLDPRVTSIRVMDPVTTGEYQYPNGYVSYMNKGGRVVNPLTGETLQPSDPLWKLSFHGQGRRPAAAGSPVA